MPDLISDGGSMTVGRRTASWTWGAFEVTLPDGQTQQDPEDDRFAEGVIYRPDDRETGRFDLIFVRADVRIDMNAEVSDLETTLDQASQRTSGDVFYTREITGLGLGRKRPGVDYTLGSVLGTMVWAKILDLPCTGIRRFSTPEDPLGVAVQVGAQVIADPEARRKRNSELDTQIATEKRQRMSEVDGVRGTADAALRLADPPRNVVPADEDGRPYWTLGATRDDTDLPQSGEPTWASTTWTGYSAAAAGAGPEAYVELSDQIDWKLGLWVKQPGAAHVRLVDEHGEDVIAEWKQHQPLGAVWFPQDRVIIEPTSTEWERVEFVVRLKPGTKTARVVVESPGLTAPLNELGLTVMSHTKEDIDAFQSQQIAENRALYLALEELTTKHGRLLNLVVQSAHALIEQVIPNQAVGSTKYTHIFEFTALEDVTWDLYFRVGWDQADRGSSYELMVAVNGAVRYKFISTSLGPLTLFGESYARQSMTRQNVSINEGDTISFWAWSNASSGPRRRIRDGVITLTQTI